MFGSFPAGKPRPVGGELQFVAMIPADGHFKNRRNGHNEKEGQALCIISRVLLRYCPGCFRRFDDDDHRGVKRAGYYPSAHFFLE
jgi:hypothetical protein